VLTSQGDITHTIKHGDTLWDLAEEYYNDPLKYELICDANGLSHNCSLIHNNNILLIKEENKQ
jgi:nucleoid-associated protein YgaU